MEQVDFYTKLKELIGESQKELDDCTYDGDYDVFCFMKECKAAIEQLQAENKELKKKADMLCKIWGFLKVAPKGGENDT